MELSGGGGGGGGGGGDRTLFVTAGVHGETAVAAAPVVAVGGKTVGETRNCQSAGLKEQFNIFGKCTRSLSPGELDEKMDTTLRCGRILVSC